MKSKSTWTLLASVALCLIIFVGAAEASNLVLYETIYATDFTSDGYGGMRDNGTGSIAVSGITGSVSTAFLYWHGPSNDTNTNANANVTFNGTNIAGTSLGLSSDNCWGYNCSQAYRADVTSLVPGDGSYTLSNFTKNNNNVNVNGVSLVTFYDDGSSANNRDVVIFNGNDSNIDNSYDAPGWNITLAGINYTSGSAYLELHVADGQTFPDAALLINGITLVPAGAIFQGTSTPSGPFPQGDGSLWDIRRFDITSFLTPGLNSLNLTTGVNSDCLSGVVAMIDLPAGAAPSQPVPEPSTFVLLGAGLIGAALIRKRQSK